MLPEYLDCKRLCYMLNIAVHTTSYLVREKIATRLRVKFQFSFVVISNTFRIHILVILVHMYMKCIPMYYKHRDFRDFADDEN